jgi:hypothetical protein
MMLDTGQDLTVGRAADDGSAMTIDDLPFPGPLEADDGGAGGGDGDAAAEATPRDAKRDLRNGWQVLAGSVLIPLGVVFIMLGWYGAAHARVVQQQIPYMVSGSFVGLGCMIVGGFLFFGHWLYRIYDQADLHHEEQTRLLEGILAALGGPGVPTAGTSPGRESAAGEGVSGDGPRAVSGHVAPAAAYYATSGGTVYHRADCAVIAHHPEDLRVLGSGAVAGMRACQICSPD